MLADLCDHHNASPIVLARHVKKNESSMLNVEGGDHIFVRTCNIVLSFGMSFGQYIWVFARGVQGATRRLIPLKGRRVA